MQWTVWMAIVIIAITIWALIKRYETRLVLMASGLTMALLSGTPMVAIDAFATNMIRGSMIVAICSAMGFAAVVSITRCDVHFVGLLVKPLGKIGFWLLPTCMLVASLVAVAIPSASGCAAALGPTMIPLMIRAGFHPAIAGAAIIGSISPSTLSPGSSHNVFIAKLAEMDVMDLIVQFAPNILTLCALNVILVTAMIFVFKDYKKPLPGQENSFVVETNDARSQLPDHPNLFMAIAPMLPVVLLVLGATVVPAMKMSVAAAMVIGTMYAVLVSRANPEKVSSEFFAGMGKGYGNILGIIIAAGVFAGGLKAAGVIDALITYLTHSNELARVAANFGPFLMGVLTGSGDAAGHAFNQSVTPYAEQFGLSIPNLGMVASLSGALGRMCSPLAGATILVAGMTRMSPMDIVKRMAPPMLINLCLLTFIFEL